MPHATRRFAVHAAAEPRHRGHTVEAASFEAAAVEFLETWHPETVDDEVTLIVTDCETGHEHCMRVDAGTGETAACD
jgi:hypothetical protein